MRIAVVALVMLSFFGVGQICRAEAWDQATPILESWQGEREALLNAPLDDPFSELAIQELAELLLGQGYVVTTKASGFTASNGLTLDLRPSSDGWFLAISRSKDAVVIGMGRYATGKSDKAVQEPARAAISPQKPAKAPVAMKRTIKMAGSPWGIAALDTTDKGEIVAALIHDKKLEVVLLKKSGVELIAEFTPPINPSRAIWIDSGDTNNDGVMEIAATWAEDVYSIDEGINSNLHGWIFEYSDERLLVKSDDLKSFARILSGQGYVQKRGLHSLHHGPITALRQSADGFEPGEGTTPWPKSFIFDATPLNNEEFLIWGDHSRLSVVNIKSGEPANERHLFNDLGKSKSPTIAVRLEEPIYRSGFSAEDRVMEEYLALPQRIVTSSPGKVYTIRHKREKGLPFIGAGDSGQDALLLINSNNTELALEREVQSVEAFAIDFAISSAPDGKTIALLLFNRDDSESAEVFLLESEIE